MRTLHYATIDSTNLEARRLAEAGERGPLWIVANEQTAGRGRLGRMWVSKPGNLYATLLLPLTAPESSFSELGFVAALAVFEASSKFVSPSLISLKWPNDCLLEGAKFCGILAETLKPNLVAIGIGINIKHVPDNLPYAATRLPAPDVESVSEALRVSLSNHLEIWDQGRAFERISSAWTARCKHVGASVSVDGINGNFEGLGPDGALLLRLPDGSVKPIYAGDVRVEYEAAR